MTLQVYDLRCEYMRCPLGTDERKPRFGWKIDSAARGAAQSAYRLQVAADEGFERLLWDSGKVASDRSAHVTYEGPPLLSRTRYNYRVTVWDRQDTASAPSPSAWWETALLTPEEWRADWIAAPLARDDEGNDPSPYLRKRFTLPGAVVSARIYATALGLYRLRVNGQPVGDLQLAPGWTSYSKRLQYQTYDVTTLLREGGNTLGATLGNGWYKGYLAWKDGRELYGDQLALLLQLHVTLADGSEQVIVSDDSWQYTSGPILMSELYHGETYDARLEQPDWDAGDWRPVLRLERTKDTLVAQECEPVRQTGELRPVALLTTPKGETVLDLGQNMVGWMRFSVEAPAGTEIRLRHAEVLDAEGNFYIGNLRSAKQLVTYICRGEGVETYEPSFTFQGFRYVQVEGWPASAGDLRERFTGCVLHSDLEPTGAFECSDPLLNQLQRNIVWGQKGNFVDVPTDCPQRDERLGWTGDAQVFIRTAAFQMNVASFFKKWLRDLAADQHEDGGVPHVIPYVPEARSNSSAWGDAAVICPWTVYLCYGDIRILEDQYASMKAWVEYIRAQGEGEYLWNTGAHFGDWLGLDAKENSYIGATPRDLIATAFYAYSTELLTRAARALGWTEDARAYGELHAGIVRAFRHEFVTPAGRVASPTQTAYALALMFDLLEERDRPRAARMLAEHIEENGTHLTTGFVGTPYLCLVLSRFGYTGLAYRLVLQQEYPSWLYSVTKGATTIWEHWDGIKPDGSFWSDDMNSYNHYAYGAVGEWLYRVVAGIDLDEGEPGYKRIRIAPQPGEQLTYAQATFASLYGDIGSAWAREADGRLRLSVTIPANTSAVVVLPGARLDGTSERGKPLRAVADGIREVAETGEGVRVEVGSGVYEFRF